MDVETLRRAIEPFFSTKGVGMSAGLIHGHGLASQLGGGLTLQSAPGEGTAVELWLRLAKVKRTSASLSDEPAALSWTANLEPRSWSTTRSWCE